MGNRLENERSPYLRQHRDNPVDWYAWGEEAFEKARREDKPVFLSIGYSTCHWCHVMAHESFEDARVAEILNRDYVAVKVDREERPDVDSVYMRFCTALSGSGGWPLTVIMTPEQTPFFVGTYLPRESRGGRLGLIPLLTALAAKWHGDRKGLERTAAELTRAMKKPEKTGDAEPSEALLHAAAEQLKSSYDEEYGGFGTAPKFPSPQNLIFLMELARLGGDKSLRAMVENTLRQMYRGGIYDHIGGGFSRYSTDREWLAPHFEKTLYDNALLALCYTEAWQDGHMALYRDVAESTLDYCLRELKAPGGGFFCGQDADSAGREGAYYLLTEAEVCKVLGAEGKHFCQCFDISPEGNFAGENIPNLLLNTRWNFLPEGYDEFKEKLRLYREERMALGTDDKILTSWNGMMLMALSRAAAAFGDRRYLTEAQELAAFMAEKLFEDGKLKARLCGDELRFDARLDDYAFYALGLLELYGADFDAAHIEAAQALARELPARFADHENGGFFSTAEDAERLVLRPKELFDGAAPSGNSAAAVLFDRLTRITGSEEWRAAAQEQLGYLCRGVGRYPAGCPFGFLALIAEVYGTREVVCALPDERPTETVKAMLARYSPELTVLLKTPKNAEKLAALAPFTAGMTTQGGKAAYYACSGGVCSLPVTEE